MWLSFTPLTWEQLGDALALEEGSSTLDPENRLNPPDIILEICQGLITFNPYAQRVCLSHSSVLTFLMSDELATSNTNYFSFTKSDHCNMIIRRSLTYFMLDGLGEGYCESNFQAQQRHQQFPLLQYALLWPAQVRRVQSLGSTLDETVLRMIMDFFTTSTKPCRGNFGAFLSALYPEPEIHPNRHACIITQPLYLSASCGMTAVVEHLLEMQPDIDLEAPGGRATSSALQVSIVLGHCATSEVLLRHGADPNSRNCYGISTIEYAYWRGCPGCILGLLDHGGIDFAGKYRTWLKPLTGNGQSRPQALHLDNKKVCLQILHHSVSPSLVR